MSSSGIHAENRLIEDPVTPISASPECVSAPPSPFLLLKNAALAILVFLCVLAMGEVVGRVYSGLAQPLLSHSYDFDLKYTLAAQSGKRLGSKPAIILLGDSLTERDIASEYLGAELHQTGLDFNVLNLGASGAFLDQNLFLLKKAVESGTHPRLVVIGLNHRSLQKPGPTDEVPFKTSYLGKCLLSPPQSRLAQLDCELAKRSHLYRNRSVLRDTLMDIPKALLTADSRVLKHPKRAMSPLGWTPLFGLVDEAQVIPETQTEGPLQYSTAMLQDTLTYCQAQNIPVLLLWMPRHPLYLKDLGAEKRQFFQQMPQKAQQFASEANIPFINLGQSEQHLRSYHDLGHMNAQGALHFTAHLAQILSQPPYRALLTTPSATETRGRKAS